MLLCSCMCSHGAPCPFRPITVDDVPEIWKHVCAKQARQAASALGAKFVDQTLCVENPDLPVFAAWQQWSDSLPSEAGALPVTRVSNDSFRDGAPGNRVQIAESLRSILATVKPAVFLARAWRPVDSPPGNVDEHCPPGC